MANESYRTRQLRKELDRVGLFYKHHGFMTAGVSDLIGCVKGRFIAIEAKLGSGTITPLQQDFLTHVVENGGVGLVARYWDTGWEMSDWATGVKYKADSIKDAATWVSNLSSSSIKLTLLS